MPFPKFVPFILFGLILAGCTSTSQYQTPPPISPTITISVSTPTVTDDQMLQDLSSDPDFKLDQTFSSLESEIK